MGAQLNLLFILFNIHIVWNLEKLILINEALTLVGGFILLFYLKKNEFRLDKVSAYVVTFFLFCTIYSIVSYFTLRDGTTYHFFRTTPFFYSSVCFFLGLSFCLRYEKFFNSIRTNRLKLFWLLPVIVMGGRLSNQVLLPFIQMPNRSKYDLFLFLTTFIFCLFKGGATSYVLLVLAFLILVARQILLIKIVTKKSSLLLIFILTVVVLYWISQEFSGFYQVGFAYFSEDSDVNALWRLMYWAYVVKEHVLEHPFLGIGFGTKLFDPTAVSAQFIVAATPDDPDLPYVHGPHNSFIYILTRTGIVGLVLFVMPLAIILKNSFTVWKHPDAFFLRVCTISLLYLLVSALFNVIVESPLYSGIYWTMLGVTHFAFLNYIKRKYI